jgi:hypothetical protein
MTFLFISHCCITISMFKAFYTVFLNTASEGPLLFPVNTALRARSLELFQISPDNEEFLSQIAQPGFVFSEARGVGK